MPGNGRKHRRGGKKSGSTAHGASDDATAYDADAAVELLLAQKRADALESRAAMLTAQHDASSMEPTPEKNALDFVSTQSVQESMGSQSTLDRRERSADCDVVSQRVREYTTEAARVLSCEAGSPLSPPVPQTPPYSKKSSKSSTPGTLEARIHEANADWPPTVSQSAASSEKAHAAHKPDVPPLDIAACTGDKPAPEDPSLILVPALGFVAVLYLRAVIFWVRLWWATVSFFLPRKGVRRLEAALAKGIKTYVVEWDATTAAPGALKGCVRFVQRVLRRSLSQYSSSTQ